MPRPIISKPARRRVIPCCVLTHKRRPADEIALVQFHDPAEVGFERGDGGMDFVAVQSHRGLQAQCVASAEPARLDAELVAGGENLVPDALGVFGRKVDLEAVFAGVAGACDAGGNARYLGVGEVVVADRAEIRRGQLLKRFESLGPWMANWT